MSRTSAGHKASAVVEELLRVRMIPDPDAARNFVSSKLRTRFTGGRDMQDPARCSAFNAGRCAWVKKRRERTDAIAGARDQEAIVFSTGMMYGQLPDGTPFEGNRNVDRYAVSEGLIVSLDVWNDSAEWLLVRAQVADAWPAPARSAQNAATNP